MVRRKKKKESMMGLAKETVGVGVVTGVGAGVVGAVGAGVPGIGVVTGPVGAGLGLVAIGQLAKVGMALPRQLGLQTKKSKKKKYLF